MSSDGSTVYDVVVGARFRKYKRAESEGQQSEKASLLIAHG
jgi:hypothetical protein